MSLSASRLCQERFSNCFHPSSLRSFMPTPPLLLTLCFSGDDAQLTNCCSALMHPGAAQQFQRWRQHTSWERRVAPTFSPLFSCCFLLPSASVLFGARRSHGAPVLRWNHKTRISDWIKKEETHCDLCLEFHPGSNLSTWCGPEDSVLFYLREKPTSFLCW